MVSRRSYDFPYDNLGVMYADMMTGTFVSAG